MPDYRTGTGVFVIFLLLGTAAGAQPSYNPQDLRAGTQQPAACAAVQAPVCAVLAGERQSFWNECQAQRAGALILSAGECRSRPSHE